MTIPQNVINIGSPETFNSLINQYHGSLFVVDVYADWCGPCKSFKPIFEAIQQQYKEKGVIFVKINFDEQKDIAEQFRVMSVPTTLFIYKKKIIHSQPGLLPKGNFANLIDQMLQKAKNK